MSAELPEQLLPGFEFGPYLIHACIGRGGMARVYRAEQAALNRLVALKVLDRWALEESSGRERFVREAKAAASIKHPNVVDILDVGVWQERPYIVMELLMGHDLDSYLDRYGVLSETEIARLALPVIAGMMAVHDAGVIHRDLKPSNIFLSDGPEGETIPKVLDFGVSKSNNLTDPLRRATKTREIVGTPAYMAPEALNGVRELGPAADQYALGAVLYECAVGRPPFEGETLLELLMAVAAGKVEAPSTLRPGISPELEQCILRAISNDPKARFETLRDLGRALWPLADVRTQTIWERSFGNGKLALRRDDGSPTLVRGLPELPQHVPGLRTWRMSLRRRWAWPLVAAASLAALGGAIFGTSETLEVSAPSVNAAPGAHAMREAPSVPGPVAVADAPSAPPRDVPAPSDVRVSESEDRTSKAVTRSVASLRTVREAPREQRRTRQTRSTARRARPSEPAQLASRDLTPGTLPADAPSLAPRESVAMRNELDGLFTSPREDEAAVVETDVELDGLFANERATARGANGAPIPD